MQYWQCVTRSFRIAWNHKYLWLIALFSGEAGGFSFNSSSGTPNTGGGANGGGTVNGTPDFGAAQQSVANFLSDNAALIIVLIVISLALVVAFFILAAVCEGATVRASAEHDAERPFGLGWAWKSGVNTMWVIVRFRLLFLLLYIPLILLFVGFFIGIVAGTSNGNNGATAGLVGVGFLLLLIAIPYLIYLFLLDRLGTRAVVLEQLMAWPAIIRAHRLLFKRFGRTLLVWLLGVAVAIVVGIATACLLAIVLVPIVLIGVGIGAASSGNAGVIAILILVGILIFLPVTLVIQGFLGAQGSTYWTLAFRRLDIDYAPAPMYQFQPPPGPPAPPPPPAPPQPAQ